MTTPPATQNPATLHQPDRGMAPARQPVPSRCRGGQPDNHRIAGLRTQAGTSGEDQEEPGEADVATLRPDGTIPPPGFRPTTTVARNSGPSPQRRKTLAGGWGGTLKRGRPIPVRPIQGPPPNQMPHMAAATCSRPLLHPPSTPHSRPHIIPTAACLSRQSGAVRPLPSVSTGRRFSPGPP